MGLDGVGLSGGVGSLSEVRQHRPLKALARGWMLPSTHPPIPLTAKIIKHLMYTRYHLRPSKYSSKQNYQMPSLLELGFQ